MGETKDIVGRLEQFAAEGEGEFEAGVVTNSRLMALARDCGAAAAEITALRSALRECADKLEIATKRLAATRGRLPDPKDMIPVLRVRALLEPSDTERETN